MSLQLDSTLYPNSILMSIAVSLYVPVAAFNHRIGNSSTYPAYICFPREVHFCPTFRSYPFSIIPLPQGKGVGI